MNDLLRSWTKIGNLPAGRRIFSFLAGRRVPYTDTIGARVEQLRPAYAHVVMHDKKRIRNHMGTVHAVALTNLAEMTGNLALMSLLNDDMRWIVTAFETRYAHKAQGRISAVCKLDGLDPNVPGEYTGTVILKDKKNTVVAEATAHWKTSAKKAAG